MTARMNYLNAPKDVTKAMTELQAQVVNSGLEPKLLNLLYLVVSRINGCAYCIDMHSKDLRAIGETDLRIDLVSVWAESPVYSDRERAAFAWAESVTKVSETHVPDDVFNLARQHFSEEQLAKLTLALIAINGWNRLCISFRLEPGHYKPGQHEVTNTRAA
jgi:AhpD family alkylhydroperoxidase